MRSEGTGGSAVTRANDPAFQMFATKSGRDIHDDLERAHRPVTSPIKLAPLTPAEEAALYSEDRPARRKLIPPAPGRAARKPATPARLPASDPGPRTGATPGPSVAPQPTRAGRGQTWHVVRWPRKGREWALQPQPVAPPTSAEMCQVITDLTNDLEPSLRTTVRRLSQAGFSQIEMAVYAGVDEQAIREALLSAGIRGPHRDHWISA